MTVFKCNECHRTFKRREELKPHLHWHKITDKDVDKYFTEEADAEPEPPAPQTPKQGSERKGFMGLFRRK